ncbi:hypothetical protein, partial [Amycolatopsis sp. NPDC003731]
MRKHAVVPPFHALDPELGVAERLLRQGNPQLCGIAAQLPDEPAAARRLNAVLAEAGLATPLRPSSDLRAPSLSPGAGDQPG